MPTCLISWLASYFEDRQQAVKIADSLSDWRSVKGGVIQGSVVGPLLFSAYFDGVVRDNVDDATSVKYADDLLLLHPMNSSSDEENSS